MPSVSAGAAPACSGVPHGSADGSHGCGLLSMCEVSRGSGGGGFSLPVAKLLCWILVRALRRTLHGVVFCACSRLAHPSGISNPCGVGVALGVAMPFDYGSDPQRAVWVLHVRVLNGVTLPCDALRLHPMAHRRHGVVSAAHAPSATPTTQVVSVRCVVSDVRCPSITSMVQCRGWVSADQGRSFTPAMTRAGLSPCGRVLLVLPCDRCAWVVMSFLISQPPPRILRVAPFPLNLCCGWCVCFSPLFLFSCNPCKFRFI